MAPASQSWPPFELRPDGWSLPPRVGATGKVPIPGGVPALPIKSAQIALAAIFVVSRLLAYFALGRAYRIAIRIGRADRRLLSAVITYPCIATTRVHGPRLVVGLLPPVLVSGAILYKNLMNDWSNSAWLAAFAAIPHITLFVVFLRQSFGGLRPDKHGD